MSARARSRISPAWWFAALALACGPRSTSEQPAAVILVLADTLRADHLGAGGFVGPISPNLDRLAREGTVYERCFAQAPWTKPSVATLFTARYPEVHGVSTHRGWFGADRAAARAEPSAAVTDVLPEEAFTLAEGFRAAGFHTAAIVANPWIRRDQGFAQGFETFVEVQTKDGAAVVAAARAWLDAHAAEGPFFLYLHLMDVHGPYDAPAADVQALAESPSLGPERTLREVERRRIPEHLATSPGASGPAAEGQRFWRSRYAAGVRVLDRHVGELRAALEQHGLLEDALLVFTADHGEELLEHGGFDHGHALFQEQLHVPLLVRRPHAAQAGTREVGLSSLVDLAPQLFTWAGLPVPAALTRAAATEVSFGSGVKWQPDTLALRTAGHMLLHERVEGQVRWRLFDLARDPLETTDVAANEPEVFALLQQRLHAHLAELARSEPLRPGELTISPEFEAELGKLGY